MKITSGMKTSPVRKAAKSKLTLEISSFSYKCGLPKDLSGHGGGFVFDCRALPNPGREARYKKLSGKSEAVIKFLKKQTEANRFFEACHGLVALAVDAYQDRGFEHLSVSFGCTGGQHRSVFMAEKLARQFKSRSGIRIRLCHRDLQASLKRSREDK